MASSSNVPYTQRPKDVPGMTTAAGLVSHDPRGHYREGTDHPVQITALQPSPLS